MYRSMALCFFPLRLNKVKFSRIWYGVLGPKLIPVYRQSARRCFLKPFPGGKLPILSAIGLRSPSQSKNVTVTVLRPVLSYTAWWQKRIGVNNLLKVVTQLCPGGNWTQDLLIASPTLYTLYAATPLRLRHCLQRTELHKLVEDRLCMLFETRCWNCGRKFPRKVQNEKCWSVYRKHGRTPESLLDNSSTKHTAVVPYWAAFSS